MAGLVPAIHGFLSSGPIDDSPGELTVPMEGAKGATLALAPVGRRGEGAESFPDRT
jgi:hypothetical protein